MKSSPSNTVTGWLGRRLYTGGAVWKMNVPVKMNFAMDSAISVGHQIEFTGCKSHSTRTMRSRCVHVTTCDRDVCM